MVGAFIIGALSTLLISIFIEYQKKPKLFFEIEDPPHENLVLSNGPIKEGRFLRVNLCNKAMPKWLQWMGRNAAMYCEGQIQFYHIDNNAPIFSKSMPIRWSNSDEPLSPQVLSGFGWTGYTSGVSGPNSPQGSIAFVFDAAKYNAAFHRNCFPGCKELIDVVARFDSDDDCYGWCNDNYIQGWRNPLWKLPQGRYICKVTVLSAGERASAFFQIENSVARTHFRLLPMKANKQLFNE
jgi:hypothetical protein